MVMNTNLLKSKRVAAGFNQSAAANEVGLGLSRYNLKENGKYPFRLEEISKMAKLYRLTVDDVNAIFFDGELPKGTN